jgi:tRNA nucleotidyltransferase (CCA-adding enzyme)
MPSIIPSWHHLHHSSDIGIQGVGGSIEEAFEQAALALTAVVMNPNLISSKEKVHITCKAPNLEILFLDWINDLIYQMATQKILFSSFDITINQKDTNLCLDGFAWGEFINLKKHHPAVEVKGATFTLLKVTRDEQGAWIAQCVVDV